MSRGTSRSLVVGVLGLVMALGVHAMGNAQALQFPSPLVGPGAPEVKRSEARKIRRGWDLLADGDTQAAAKKARKSGRSAAAALFRLQITLVRGSTDVRAELEATTQDHPDYAAAWLTRSVAAELAGDEAEALRAARRGAELWPHSMWRERVVTLHDRLVEQRVEDADELLGQGDPAAALAAVRVALELEPEHRKGRLVAARALLQQGEIEDAEAILVSLGGDSDALFMSGRIAERRQDWQNAMDLFAAVPQDSPGRDAALRRVKLRWRLTQLPAHVQEALASPRLTRAQLAVLLVDLMPRLETFSGGTVPVLSDIVDLPSHREVLTAVRLDLLEVDPLEHSFHPHRAARPREVVQAVEGLCHLLGLETPMWCQPGTVVSSSCTALAEPLTGEIMADLVLNLEQGESQ